MADVRQLGFVVRILGWTAKRILLEVFIIVQNLVWITAVALIVQKFEYFTRLAWKGLSRPKNRVFGVFDPQNGMQYERDSKRHFLMQQHVIWCIDR